jgi:hypothetical protein
MKGMDMNTFHNRAIGLALGIAFSTGGLAAGISQDEYSAGKDWIAAEYKVANAACAPLAGNAFDICVAEAKGKEKVATAGLDDSYELTRESLYQVRIAEARADYAVANEKCDALAGNTKDVCVMQAKAVQAGAEADAKVQLKSSAARARANEKSVEARLEANHKIANAIKDGIATQRAADLKLANAKCEGLSGSAKEVCAKDAEVRFGK